MTRRKVVFPPDDYWTNPPKENSMTDDHATEEAQGLLKYLVAGLAERSTTGLIASAEIAEITGDEPA